MLFDEFLKTIFLFLLRALVAEFAGVFRALVCFYFAIILLIFF